ncbi:hypothetical protein N9488_01545 [Flavobacteriales bacterium]|nr:hypothetical protein [Flavobacteriales bacterium]
MTIKNLLFFTSILVTTLISSCKGEEKIDNCISNELGYIYIVDSPSTGIVNETITMKVFFSVNNGCGGFKKFITCENGNTRTIEVEAIYEGCICTDNVPTIEVEYRFIGRKPGDYLFKFKSSPTDFIAVPLTIN